MDESRANRSSHKNSLWVSSEGEQNLNHCSRDLSANDGRRSESSVNLYGVCYANNLPSEILNHIFSYCDPFSLGMAGQVCKRWKTLISDDTCWKNAFLRCFGSLPFSRLTRYKWKDEYILRDELLRRWRNEQCSGISFDTRLETIYDFYVDFERSWMLAGSVGRAAIVRCNPITGRIIKDKMYATRVNLTVTVMKIDGHRILWGFANGMVGITHIIKQGASINYKDFRPQHEGAVTVLEWSRNCEGVVLSGGEDGYVCAYHATFGCFGRLYSGSPSHIKAIAWNPNSCVIAGTTEGSIHVWQTNLTHIENNPLHWYNVLDVPHHCIQGTLPIKSLHCDMVSNSVIVGYEDSTLLKIYDLRELVCVAMLEDGHIANISYVEYYEKNVTTGKCNPEISARILLTGDASGKLCLWNIAERDSGQVSSIKPLRVFVDHTTEITATFMDDYKLIIGSADGKVTVWDQLTGELIRQFSTVTRRSHYRSAQARGISAPFAIKCICCDDERITVAMGRTIRTWYLASKEGAKKGRQRRKKPALSSTSKALARLEFQNDVRESTQLLAREQRDREERRRHLERYIPSIDFTDEEMMQYAILLSTPTEDEDEQISEAIARSLSLENS